MSEPSVPVMPFSSSNTVTLVSSMSTGTTWRLAMLIRRVMGPRIQVNVSTACRAMGAMPPEGISLRCERQ